jgi:hypothetical protein
MTPQDALIELLGRVGANQGAAVLVNDEELRQWPDAAVKAMKSQKLIVKASPASSAICPGCERECVMPVHTLPDTAGTQASFIVCDKRNDINRVTVPAKGLKQWKCSADLVCVFAAASLGLRRSARQTGIADLWEIGIAFGAKRSQMLCLKGNGTLTLIAGSNTVPLAEFIDFHDGKYLLDDTMISQLVDTATAADNRYTPSNVMREARKLETQAMYESWKMAYRNLRKKRKNMSDVWYSRQIAKMDIARRRDAETIRKHMKK